MKRYLYGITILVLILGCGSAFAADNPFLGNWALTIPGGRAGWLNITQDAGFLDASLLWGGGSVLPVDSVYRDGDALVVTRSHKVTRKDAGGGVIREQLFTDTITAKVTGDILSLVIFQPKDDGTGVTQSEFAGKRIPPLPAAPNLTKLKFGKAIKLFNGKNLDGWELTNPASVNGWSAQKGVLVNEPVQEEGKPRKSYGNLRTKREFEDFNFKCEVLVEKGGNSGIYLRGIYEVQVAESYGQPIESHVMGAIYSRIAPTVAAQKPAGEWQTLDITLCDRHVTVRLNDTVIIENQPLPGCTGGALWSDEFRPGPIYLQGDHTGVKYRNIALRPIIKK